MNFHLARGTAILAVALASAAPLAAQSSIPGLDAAGIDTTVRPGDGFYHYANGGWERRTEIPNDRSSFGSFNIAAKLADVHVKEIVHGAASAHAAAGSELHKIGDFYTSYLDTAAINARGAAPIRPLLDSIAAIADKRALARFIGAHLRADVDPINLGTLHTDNLFGFWVTQDFNRPSRYSAALLQGGIEMPDRSYYLDESPKMAEIRAAYRAHIARMLTLAGIGEAESKADSIVALETSIARTHWKLEDSEDPAKGNNHWARTEFTNKAPGLDWPAFFAAAGLAGQDSILAWQPSAITGISALVASEPLATWKSLLAYHAIENRSAVLPSAFDREAFDFFGKTLSGAPEQASRDDRAVDATSFA